MNSRDAKLDSWSSLITYGNYSYAYLKHPHYASPLQWLFYSLLNELLVIGYLPKPFITDADWDAHWGLISPFFHVLPKGTSRTLVYFSILSTVATRNFGNFAYVSNCKLYSSRKISVPLYLWQYMFLPFRKVRSLPCKLSCFDFASLNISSLFVRRKVSSQFFIFQYSSYFSSFIIIYRCLSYHNSLSTISFNFLFFDFNNSCHILCWLNQLWSLLHWFKFMTR